MRGAAMRVGEECQHACCGEGLHKTRLTEAATAHTFAAYLLCERTKLNLLCAGEGGGDAAPCRCRCRWWVVG
jgi:hypothetical protein